MSAERAEQYVQAGSKETRREKEGERGKEEGESYGLEVKFSESQRRREGSPRASWTICPSWLRGKKGYGYGEWKWSNRKSISKITMKPQIAISATRLNGWANLSKQKLRSDIAMQHEKEWRTPVWTWKKYLEKQLVKNEATRASTECCIMIPCNVVKRMR